jgi:hypothetical protein
VAQAKLRLAAGVAMTATCLLAGGTSTAVAIADPGHRGHSGHSNHGKGSDHRRGGSGGSKSDSPRGGDSGRSDDNIITITEAPRLAKLEDDDNNNDKDNNNDNDNAGGAKADSDGRPSSRLGSGRESGTSEERSGSDYSPDPPGRVRAPKVKFGDGRSPGVQNREPEPSWRVSPPEPAPPPPPPAEVITVPLNPPTLSPVHVQPGVVQQLVVAPTSGWGDPLWGVAGLLLIPAAGAILGYRQARGAHAAAELGRHP